MLFCLKRSPVLLILGLLFASISGCSPVGLESPAVASLLEAKILRDRVELGPSANVSVKKVQFFESGRSSMELRKQRQYQVRFPQSATRTIYTEIQLEHPELAKRVEFAGSLIVSRPSGTIFRIEEYGGRIESDWTSSYHWIGVGHHSPGNWDAGIYTVEVYIGGNKVATGSFEIYP